MQDQRTINAGRIERLKEILRERTVGALLVINLANIRYLTGFSGSSGFLLISEHGDFFFTDFRYKEQSETEVSGAEIVITENDSVSFITNFMIEKLGFEEFYIEDTIPLRQFQEFGKKLKVSATQDVVEVLRELKDAYELQMISKAVERAERALIEVKPYIRPGVTEREIALRLDESLKTTGVRKLPFDTIIASGVNTAIVHAKPTEKLLEPGDFVLIDWGGECEGYFSDMTRTFLLKGDNLAKKREIYEFVQIANELGRTSVTAGKSAAEIDTVTRDIITKAGYGQYFGHSTGHGVGLDVHELPYIRSYNTQTTIQQGMVFTIEPGIYISGLGGVRIEDMVVVENKNNCKTLTSLPRNLEIL
ncbi:MAG: aminopeptidase P family protein [Nitrospirae bacterium]|nr:aminopeptidase P family protein [Nitrospirota bacterium]MBF0536523.1 aminopeptidase P family protein [Nitrospirota bacterium]MBF0617825.1 aminopeptidase P family protein [Nitrospirota bacterium]